MSPDQVYWQVVLGSVFTMIRGAGSVYRTDYLQDSCSCTALHKLDCEDFTLRPVIGGAGHVALARGTEFYREFYCQFTILAPEGMKVKLTVNNVTIPMSKSCKAGSLSVYDGTSDNIKGWPMTGICGNLTSERYIFSNENALTIYYNQGKGILREKKALNFTYSYYKPVKEPSECDESEMFLCESNECIQKSLECDGVPNCRDSSDESKQFHLCKKYTTSNPTVGVAVGGAVGIVIAVALVSAIVISLRRKHASQCPASDIQTQPVHCSGVCPSAPQCAAHQYNAAYPDITRDLPPHLVARENVLNGDRIYQSHYGTHERPPSYSSLFPDA